MDKKGISKKRQRRLTLIGVSSALAVWLAALALLFSQPGAQSGDNVLPTLASNPLQEVVSLPDTGAPVDTVSPTILPTGLPIELPAEGQAQTSLVSAPSNILPAQSQNPFSNIPALDIPAEPVPNSMVIRFKPDMSQQERLDYIASLGGQIVQEIEPLNTVIIDLPGGMAARSQSAPPAGVENEPDFYAGALLAPNDTLAAGQWGLTAVRAPEAWDLLPTPTASLTVAVVDSGICAGHPDLQGRILSNGWDFVQNDDTPQDEFGHGCAVSGVISANSNNGLGIAGVAPNTNVMPLRVLDAGGIGRYSNVAAAIVYAVDNGAAAINLSLGGPNPSSVLQEAVNYAEAHGVTVIAAAGNGASEQVYYPAAYEPVVAVGAVDQNLERSPFSNFGPGIDLYAPGSNIMTTSLDGSFQTSSGTSLAAPYVTGVWALRRGMDKELVINGGIVAAIFDGDTPPPPEEPPSELCLVSNMQGAEAAYFDLVSQNASQPGTVTSEQLQAARDLYLTLAGQCANILYNDTMTIDGGGISPFGGDISPLFQIFGTKWKLEGGTQVGATFNQGQPPAEPSGIIRYSFMPNNVSLAAKEAENGGGAGAFTTAISDLPGNVPGVCNLQARIEQAFDAWELLANVQFVPMEEIGIVPFGETGGVGDMRIGAQAIDGLRGELGHAYFPPPDPEIATSTRSGDVFFDRSEIWGCAPGEIIGPDGSPIRVIDIGLVMLHELGHGLGMQHERTLGVLALMNPTYNAGLITDAAGGTLPLVNALRTDDQAGARAIYGGLGVAAPSLTPIADPNDNTPTFAWTDTTAGGSDYFQIQIYVDVAGQPGALVFEGTTTGGNPTSPNKTFTIPTALPSQPYLWRMRSFDNGAFGDWSGFQSFSITVGIASLLNPSAGEVFNVRNVEFQWSLIQDISDFRLQIDTRPEFPDETAFILNQQVSGISFAFTLPEDGTFYWRVQTISSGAFSQVGSFVIASNVPIVNLADGAPNASPTNGEVFTTNTNITLTWGALPDISDYQVQLDTSENFVGLLFLDKLFLDKLFLDKLFLDKLFLDKLFLDKLFLDKLFLDKLFLDKLFLDKLFLDKLFLDKLFLDKLFLDKLFLDKLFLDKLFLDKLFLDKLFLDKVLAPATGDTVSQVFDTLPMSEGVHYWRVRPRLVDGSFGPWSEMRSFEVRTQPVKVVINEIKLDDPSWIEFQNTGSETANMNGWQFFAYGPNGETDLLYTFPSGFSLDPGEYVVLYEGEGTDTPRALFTGGTQIDWPLVAQEFTAQTVNEPSALTGLGAVVPPVMSITSVSDAGAESASSQAEATSVLPVEVQPSVSLSPELLTDAAATSNEAEDGDVSAQQAFVIAIGDTVSDGVPGPGAGNIELESGNDTYTFTGTAGQVVNFDTLANAVNPGTLLWRLRNPNTNTIFGFQAFNDINSVALPLSGTYTLDIHPESFMATGTYSFRTVLVSAPPTPTNTPTPTATPTSPPDDTPQTAPTFTVNTTATTNDGVCGTINCTLIEAINAANEAGGINTINLGSSQTYTLTVVDSPINGGNGLPIITSIMTINGNGSTITRDAGAPEFRIFYVEETGVLTLNNTTISEGGGPTLYGGGGILNFGALTLSDVTLTNNMTDQAGGAIFNSGTLTINDSTIQHNTANSESGIFNTSTATITHSNIIGNTASNGASGGILNSGAMILTDTTVADNSATEQGGGIANHGTLTITASTLSGNTANTMGGAIYNAAGTLTLTNSTVAGNTSLSTGGGFHNEATLTLNHVTVANNFAEGGNQIFNDPDGTINTKNTIVARAGGAGSCLNLGTIQLEGDNYGTDASCTGFSVTTPALLNLGSLTNNGGPTQTIALGAGSVAIDAVTDCTTFGAGGTAVTTDQRGITRPQGTQCDAGAVETEPATDSLTVTTTDMIQDGLDGLCSLPEAIIAANTDTPSGATLGECVPADDGSLALAADTINLAANATYTLTQVDNTTALAQGGGANGLPVVTSPITLDMNGSTIRRAADAADDFRIIAVSGTGNLSINGGGGTISGGRLMASGANGLGGAIYNEGTTSMNNVTIENNLSGSGALASYGTLNVATSTLRNNQTPGYGGVIYSLGQLNVGVSVFENNQSGLSGGALFNSGTGTVERSSFVNNSAGDTGGAIINAGSMSIVNATFSGNQAEAGSAVENLGSTLTIHHATIADNIMTNPLAGAINNAGAGSVTLTGSIVANNTGGDNCSGSITDGGGNIQFPGVSCFNDIDTVDPLLGQLTFSGIHFYPLLNGSPALDRAAEATCPATDIRGVARPAGNCDSGSYEGSVALTGDLTVTTTSMAENPTDGLCSLVEAIDAANSGDPSGSAPGECVPAGDADVITLGSGLTYTLTTVNNVIGGENGLPVIVSPITIEGNGSTITRSSEALFRHFYVDSAGSLTLNNLTLSNGFSGMGGGAILADGSLTLSNSTIADNEASSGGGLFISGDALINSSAITGNDALSNDGGGIFVEGSLTLVNSTLAGNSANTYGGGLVTSADDFFSPDVTIINSTIAGNTSQFGAGLSRFFGTINVTNSIIANNLNTSSEPANCAGAVADGGSNIQWPDFSCPDTISSLDPLLGPLTGSPAYLPLGVGSPAIDTANDTICAGELVNNVDQRGVPRPQGAHCDIGSVEVSEVPALTPGSTGGAASLTNGETVQDFVRFGDTTLGPLVDTEWRGSNVAIPALADTADTNVTIGRDPAGSDTNHVTDWLTQRPTAGGQNIVKVLINEIFTGSNDLVELYNPAAETVNLFNWELILYDADDQIIPATPGAIYTVRFPEGTLLRPGQFLIIAETNPGAGTNFIPAGVPINWDDWNASGAVSLTNGLTGIDFVRFGGSDVNQLAVEPPPGTSFTGIVQPPLPSESLGRDSNSSDTDRPSDWISQTRSVGLSNPAIAPAAADEFTNAININPLPFRDTGNTINASAVNDPALSCGVSAGHTVWYKYVAANNSPVRFQTDGSTFDTVLAIFRLGAGDQLIPMGLCSQRGNAPIGSRLTLNPASGNTYYILLGGNLGASGAYTFSANAPANDDVDAAAAITTLPFQTFQPAPTPENPDQLASNTNTTAASRLQTDPSPTCAANVGRSVWYRYTAADETTLRLRTTGTPFDTVIAIYTGQRDPANGNKVIRESLVEAACNNDDFSETTSDLAFTLVVGTEYFIQVAGSNDAGDALFFEVDVFPTPANDEITAAFEVIPDGDGTFSVDVAGTLTEAPFAQDTTGALSVNADFDDPVATPGATCGLSQRASVWFVHTYADDPVTTVLDSLVVQTLGSNYDTGLSIWTAIDPLGDLNDPANLELVACNDDVGVNKGSRITLGDVDQGADVAAIDGQTYYIRVSGYYGATGDLLFNVYTPQADAPDNDPFDGAFEIAFNQDDGTYTVISPAGSNVTPFMQDTTGATPSIEDFLQNDEGLSNLTCGDDVGYTVWYHYQAPERQRVVLDAVGSDFDTVVAAFVQQSDGTLVEVGCNDDFEGRPQSKLTLNTDQGVTLYILFGGYKKDRGNLDLSIVELLPIVDTFTLVDAGNVTNGAIVVDPLEDGAELNLSDLPDALTIRANTTPTETGSVRFELYAGEIVDPLELLLETTDNTPPYALSGNNPLDGTYIPTMQLLTPGTYTLKATPYTAADAMGRIGFPLTITFTVVEGEGVPPTVTADETEVTVDEGLIAANTGTFDDPDGDPTLVELTASVGAVIPATDGTWSWTFQTSDGPAESQTVTITATDEDGDSDSVAFDLVVNNVAPTASLNVEPVVGNPLARRLTVTNQDDDSSIDLATGFTYLYDCTNDGIFDTEDGEPVDDATFDCVFAAFGTYTAKARIIDKDGGFSDMLAEITLVPGNQPPTADAGDDQTVTATRPTLTASVTLDGSGSADSDGIITRYLWTEGTTTLADVTTPTTIIALPIGVHTITLTVTDDDDATNFDTVIITVEPPANTPPVADAGDDQTITDADENGGELVTLDGSGSTDAEGNETIVSYIWTELVSGVPTQIATGKNPGPINLPLGVHTITLTVTDDLGATDTDDVVITIQPPANIPPVANAGATATVVNDTAPFGTQDVTLDGSLSTDSDGMIVRYLWTEGAVTLADVTTPQTIVNLPVGTHNITLTVYDNDGDSDTDTVTVKVNAPPLANAGPDQTVTDTAPFGAQDVTLNGSGSSDSDGTIVAYSWTEGATVLSTQVSPTISLSTGAHSIKLTVTDNNGATDDDEVIITVALPGNTAPVVNAGNDQTITLPTNTVSLAGTVTDDGLPLPPSLTFTWSQASGTPGVTFSAPNALNTNATFPGAGQYTLRLTASDGQLSGSDDVVITVNPESTGNTTITEQVNASLDDVNEDGNSFDTRNPQLWAGTGQSVTQSYLGIRFNNVDVPKGAVITEAYVQFYTATSQWIRMRVLIGADAVDNSVTFAPNSRPSGRAFTTARLTHVSDTPWMAGTWTNLGNIKDVIQEIVNRGGWQAGNSLSIIMRGQGAQWGRKFITSYDGNPAFAPRLVVVYAGGPTTNTPPDVNVDPGSADVIVNEGQLAFATGTVTDAENNVVTLLASVGNVVKNGNTWSWSYTPLDNLPAPLAVTITARDSQNLTDTATFNLTVNNVAPTATFTAAPLSTFPNSPVTLSFSAPLDVPADLPGLLYSFNCGNGVTSAPSPATQFTCTYAAEGMFTVIGVIADKDSGSTTYTATINVTTAPTEPATITAQVNGASDDVNEVAATFEANNPDIWVGTYGTSGQAYTGLRFNNLGIPVGATITEAHLEFYSISNQWISVDVVIAADAADNSPTFSAASRPSGRVLTGSQVEHHSNVSWPANSWNVLTGNLSGVLQEVVGRAGWQPGNSLSLILHGIGDQFGRKFVTSYDGNPAFAPRLVVSYTMPETVAPLMVVPPPITVLAPIPPSAAFTSSVAGGVAPLPVQFSNSSSGDIAAYAWNFGDGGGSADANPAHTYSAAGTYTVTLTVTGADGSTSTAGAVITVTDPPPPVIEAIIPPTEEATASPESPVEETAAP